MANIEEKSLREYLDELNAKSKAKADASAKDFLYNKKLRKPFYFAQGEMLYDEDGYNEAYFDFSDEELAQIKALIIKVANESYEPPVPVETVEEALKDMTFHDIFEQSEELRMLLLERCEDAFIYPLEIDLNTRHYFYEFGCIFYDYERNEISERPLTFDIPLSDDEYLTLLSLQLQDRLHFNYNKLMNIDQELALKLNDFVAGKFCANIAFTLLFDEIRADAETIDGPLPANDELYDEDSDCYILHVMAEAASHVLTITEEKMAEDDLFARQRILNDIDADKVMNALEAKDYKDMMAKLKEKFDKYGAFDNIKSWLTSMGFTYNEPRPEDSKTIIIHNR